MARLPESHSEVVTAMKVGSKLQNVTVKKVKQDLEDFWKRRIRGQGTDDSKKESGDTKALNVNEQKGKGTDGTRAKKRKESTENVSTARNKVTKKVTALRKSVIKVESRTTVSVRTARSSATDVTSWDTKQ